MESVARIGAKRFKRGGKKEEKSGAGVLKSLLLGVIAGLFLSCLLVLLYAFLLYKQVLAGDSMAWVNVVIKVLSAALTAFLATRGNVRYKILVGALAGGAYVVCAFLLFSLFTASFNFGVSLLLDVLLGVLSGLLLTMVVNIFKT